jgi:hypothetical protein
MLNEQIDSKIMHKIKNYDGVENVCIKLNIEVVWEVGISYALNLIFDRCENIHAIN